MRRRAGLEGVDPFLHRLPPVDGGAFTFTRRVEVVAATLEELCKRGVEFGAALMGRRVGAGGQRRNRRGHAHYHVHGCVGCSSVAAPQTLPTVGTSGRGERTSGESLEDHRYLLRTRRRRRFRDEHAMKKLVVAAATF